MTRKPWIGIPTRFHDNGQPVDAVSRYVDAVLLSGGLPVMIPITGHSDVAGVADVAAQYAARLDGILLPGSPTDIEPALYGETPHPKLGKLFPEREALDFALLEHSERENLPVLGICFGVQSLNVFRGGSLIQDVPSVVSTPLAHDDGGNANQPARHNVRLEEGSRLRQIVGVAELDVNSFHHQAVARVGRGLRLAATSDDGVIEAVEGTSDRFVVGVQWHPERGYREDSFSQILFAAFIRAAAKTYSDGHSV